MNGERRRWRRRGVLGAAAAAAAGLVVGCGGTRQEAAAPATNSPGAAGAAFGGGGASTSPGSPPRPTVTPTPTPPPPAGQLTRVLLEGTPSETELVVRHSGIAGPVLLFLGGVHGNEPGGWLAADEVSTWKPAAGSLVVLPRANVQAIAGFIRTYDEIGDLNRLFPGKEDSSLLMERMAATIVAVAREFRVEVAVDLHESWAFYATRSTNGTAFLGQTVSSGVGPRNPGLVAQLVEGVNAGISRERDLLIARDGTAFRRDDQAPNTANRGRSSLSLGGHVPGLTPILVEMGQEDQPVERRVELHLAVAERTAQLLGVL